MNLISKMFGVSNSSSQLRIQKVYFCVGNVSRIHRDDLIKNAVNLPLVDTVKDLVTQINLQLKLDLHISTVVARTHTPDHR